MMTSSEPLQCFHPLSFLPCARFLVAFWLQEVVKATGKFTPLGEFLYLDAVGSLTLEAQHVSSASPSDALEQFSFTRKWAAA